jgi:hypothetical protein
VTIVQQCPTCGKNLAPTVRFCPEDGTPLTETAAASGLRTPTAAMATKKSMLALPVTVGNRYMLTETRGGGGMATVYRATDLTLEREVAVKLINPELRLDPEFDARFQREARIASQLADPHIVVVHDFGIDPTHGPFLVMEFLQGLTLRERLQKDGPLPFKACLQLCGQLFLALIHAHDRGIVHRDIKPDNLFLLYQSGLRLHMRVLDFGIARMLKKDEQTTVLTHPGAVMGTPRYMSPEQLAGQNVDARSDIYSAALVIYESLTGQLPYTSEKKLCELCPEAPAGFEELIVDCLKPDPGDRPSSAVEIYVRLQEVGKASGILMLPPGALDNLIAKRLAEATTLTQVTAPAPKPAYGSLRVALIAGAAILALAAGVFGVIAWQQHFWMPEKTITPDQESLLGIKIGDSADELIAKFKKPRRERLKPWKERAIRPANPAHLVGEVLQSEDVGGEDDRFTLEALVWEQQHVTALVRDNEVRALIVAQPHKAASGRGLSIGDEEGRIVHVYSSVELPEMGEFHTSPPSSPPPGWKAKKGRTYRYNSLGIGFEVIDEKIAGITLFQARPSETASEGR